MIAARATKIIAEKCQNNLKRLKFAPATKDETIFRFERPDRLRLGDQPTAMDPYEQKTVYVQDLAEYPGEQGLFAKRDISTGEQIAFYSGNIYQDSEMPTITPNMTEQEMWENPIRSWRGKKSFLIELSRTF